jgi:hypothetical protein
MVLESEFLFWVIAGAVSAFSVAVGLVGMVFGAVGYIILRDRGYGTVRSMAAVIAAMLIAGVAVVVVSVPMLATDLSDPSPMTDLSPLVVVAAGFLGFAVAGVLCWAVARVMPKIGRRDGGPRRRFRYGRWGVVFGLATIPLCAVLWWIGGWMEALRGPYLTVPSMLGLFVLEARARNRLDDDAELGTFVLSLRSFADDLKLTIKAQPEESTWAQPGNSNYVNLEQFIADEMGRRIGRLVAFGSPRDKLPAGGAGRLYAPEAHWPERVEALAVAARAIVMQIGNSPSLSAELAIIKRCDLATKLFIVTVPAGRSGRFGRFKRWLWRAFGRLVGWPEPTWSDFAALLERNGLDPGECDPGPGAVIAFDVDGSRVDVRLDCRTPGDYVRAMESRLASSTASSP